MSFFKPAGLRLVDGASSVPSPAAGPPGVSGGGVSPPSVSSDGPGGAAADALYLSPDLSVPLDMVTQAQAIVAQRGSGKTYTAKVLAEEFLERALPVLIIDPLGVFNGLQSSADGQRAGYAVPIFGGDHANAPLPPPSEFVEWLLRLGPEESPAAGAPGVEGGRSQPPLLVPLQKYRSAILDVSVLRKAPQAAYVTEVVSELFQRSRGPLHVIVDEADLFAPQRPGKSKEAAKMLEAFEDIVRRGRVRGLGITMITQRPAVIHKDVLTQVSTLVILRMMGPHDRAAIREWIRLQASEGQAEKVLSSLGALPIGTAWFWSPGWLGILKKVRIRRQRTFDSSSTPKIGEEKKVPRVRATIPAESLP